MSKFMENSSRKGSPLFWISLLAFAIVFYPCIEKLMIIWNFNTNFTFLVGMIIGFLYYLFAILMMLSGLSDVGNPMMSTLKASMTFLGAGVLLSIIHAKGFIDLESGNNILYVAIACSVFASLTLWNILFGKLKFTFENIIIFFVFIFFFYKCSYNGGDSFKFIQKIISFF